MHAVPNVSSVTGKTEARHQWVGAALVGLGVGNSRRAEHAARTGRHVLNDRTRIEVLEVYCGRCRVPYSATSERRPCSALAARAG